MSGPINMRVQFIRGWLLALYAEGVFKDTRTASEIFAKAREVVVGDIRSALSLVVDDLLMHGIGKLGEKIGGSEVGDALLGQLEGLAGAFREGGLGAMWKKLQEDYWRGADVKAGRNRKD